MGMSSNAEPKGSTDDGKRDVRSSGPLCEGRNNYIEGGSGRGDSLIASGRRVADDGKRDFRS
eukprot:9526979-Karenia_brevis.AAC.1